MRSFSVKLMVSTCVAAIAFVPAAWAQQAASNTDDIEEVVVTGTLLRGVVPVGQNIITISSDDIKALGQANLSEVLATIPQLGGFNMVATPGIVGNGSGSATNTANLRGAPGTPTVGVTGGDTAGGTLLLLDGHRLPDMGITSNAPDLNAIPFNAIERIDVATDGGSALYGSDAIGGVINYVTRKSFDGVEGGANFATANNYTEFDQNIIAGHEWGPISAYIAYDHEWHDALNEEDRSYAHHLDWSQAIVPVKQANGTYLPTQVGAPPPYDTLCDVGDSAGNVIGPGGGAPTTRCDLTQHVSIVPAENRHSLFGRVTIDNGGPVAGSITAFYTHREDVGDQGPIDAGSPTTVAGTAYYYNLGPVYGNATPENNTLETYGISPEIHARLGGDWQVSLLGNYGYGESTFLGQNTAFNPGVLPNGSTFQTYANAGQVNFLDLTDPANKPIFDQATDWYSYGRGQNKLLNARWVVDGTVFQLPGGDVKAATGMEYSRETYNFINTNATFREDIPSLQASHASRNVWAAFGELNVPLVSPDNHWWISSAALSAAGRYDDYSDFGHTFNPKVSLDVSPVDWIQLQGKWTTSFQAPGLNNVAAEKQPTNEFSPSCIPSFVAPLFLQFGNPAGAPPNAPYNGGAVCLIEGTEPGLGPQKATIYTWGANFEPPWVEGLSFGADWYHTKVKNLIGQTFTAPSFYNLFPQDYASYSAADPNGRGGPAALTAMAQKMAALFKPGSPDNLGLLNYAANPNLLYAIFDAETSNTGTSWTEGYDFHASYTRNMDFGSLFANFNGTLAPTVSRSESVAGLVNGLTLAGGGYTAFLSSTTIGAQVGKFTASATWQHTGSHAIDPGYPYNSLDTAGTAGNYGQTTLGAFDVVNLFFRYSFDDNATWLSGTDLTLNVQNILDTDPPAERGQIKGYADNTGQTLGREFNIGFTKRF